MDKKDEKEDKDSKSKIRDFLAKARINKNDVSKFRDYAVRAAGETTDVLLSPLPEEVKQHILSINKEILLLIDSVVKAQLKFIDERR